MIASKPQEPKAQAARQSSLSLKNREVLTVTGVSEVISYHENEVLIKTELGTLRIIGEALKLGDLSLAGQSCIIEGKIGGMIYEKPIRERKKRRLFSDAL